MFKKATILALVSGLLAVSAARARAQEPVSNLRVVDAGGGAIQSQGDTYSFPAGTKKVTVLVDYNLASPQKITADVVALGVRAASLSNSFSGRGTARFDLVGEALYSGVAKTAARTADDTLVSLDQVLKSSLGISGYLDGVNQGVTQISQTVPVLQGLTLDSAYAQDVAAMAEAARTASTVVVAALAASGAEAQKAKAAEARPALTTMQAKAKAVADRLGRETGLGLPPTGNDGRTPIDVTVRVAGSPAGSLAIQVGSGSLVPNATATRPAPTAGAGGGSGGAATAPSSAGLAPTSGRPGVAGPTAPPGASGGIATPLPVTPGAGMAGSGALGTSSTAIAGSTEAAAVGLAPAGEAAGTATVVAGPGDQAQAPPTWTVPAGSAGQPARALAGGAPEPGGSAAGNEGLGANLAVIALGALLLVVAAAWLRRRM